MSAYPFIPREGLAHIQPGDANASPKGPGSIYLGQVATRCYMPNSIYNGIKQCCSRTAHRMRSNAKNITLVFPNFAVIASGAIAEVGSGNPVTITASIEYPSGVFTQVRFGSSTSGTIPDGGMLTSNPVAITIPQGAWFRVRTYSVAPNSIVATTGITSISYNSSLGDQLEGSSTTLVDNTLGGGYNSASNITYGPIAILANTVNPSVLLIGDSRTFGQADTADASGDTGNLARSLGPSFGYINLGLSGDRVDKFLASHVNRKLLGGYCSHVVVASGGNDLLSGNRTSAQVIADLKTLAGYFSDKPVFGCTVEPTTSSTDSWATEGNQIVSNIEAARVALNEGIRSVLAGTQVTLTLQTKAKRRETAVSGVTPATPATGCMEANLLR